MITSPRHPLRGVSWRADRNKWVATVTIHGKSTYVGSFDTQEEARAAHCRVQKMGATRYMNQRGRSLTVKRHSADDPSEIERRIAEIKMEKMRAVGHR